jgi:thiol-disulfide isomerase/thioredoxin
MRTRSILIAIFIGAVLLTLGACSMLPTNVLGTRNDNPGGGRPTTAKIGALAPEINLKSMTGDQIVLSQLVGRPVLVNFWATWCAPCRAEFPAFARKYKELKDQGFVILGVNTQDDNSDEGVLTFMRNSVVNFPIVRDRDDRLSAMYNVRGLPTSIFIDKQGIIRDIVIGGPMTDEFIDQQFQLISK